jgi:hypothetical protein
LLAAADLLAGLGKYSPPNWILHPLWAAPKLQWGEGTAGAQGRLWALTFEPWMRCKVFCTIFVKILIIVHDASLGRMEDSTYMDFIC